MPKLSADQFYALRDDRTNRLTPSRDYHRLGVCLVAGQDAVNSFAGQVTLLLAANLLARWCRHVELVFPDAALAPVLARPTRSTLREQALAEMKSADPFGTFTVLDRSSPATEYVLSVGEAVDGVSADFQVAAAGWHLAAGGSSFELPRDDDSSNPLGAAMAACLGVADALKLPAANRPVDGSKKHTSTYSVWT